MVLEDEKEMQLNILFKSWLDGVRRWKRDAIKYISQKVD
jgi:hypothetical protein